MMADFRRIFKPTAAERLQDYEFLLKLHDDQLGKCSTCENHIPSDMPGCVTDYGSCAAESPLFSVKSCGLEEKTCPLYVERSLETIKQEIERIRRESQPDGEEAPC